jgi:hypothetical protein
MGPADRPRRLRRSPVAAEAPGTPKPACQHAVGVARVGLEEVRAGLWGGGTAYARPLEAD